ncbi:M12 family metallo-peptidase [Gammaproteobacteria bacterium]|nr:M12 family metallo-peptidase [Gammaproteobacteria bacterium]
MSIKNRNLCMYMTVALAAALLVPTQWSFAATSFAKPCRNAGYLTQQVREALGENLTQFELRSFDTRSFVRSGARRPLDLVLPNEKNEMVKLRVAVQEFPGRVKGLTEAFLKGGGTRARAIKLPREMNFQLGKCEKRDPTCGNLAVIGKQVEGFVIDKSIGFALFEPVEMLMKRHGMKRWRGDRSCHIVYNANFHGPIPVEDKHDHKQGSRSGQQGLIPPGEQVAQDLRRSLENVGNFLIEPANAMPFPTHIPIKLDSDAEFYSLSPSTVWSRQLSVINSVRIIYGLIEPLTNGDWSIIFDVEGQESWLPGHGPTTTDKYDLLDEINDPGYYMIHHADNNEVSYFFVGYDMSGGIAGIAGGICNYPGYDETFGSDEEHQDNHAWGQQVEDVDGGYAFSTLYGRIIVATHEIGHMLGALHGDGCTGATCCATGLFPFMCGNSIMMSGASGGVAPDFRDPFFTPDNSANIKDCVDDVY